MFHLLITQSVRGPWQARVKIQILCFSCWCWDSTPSSIPAAPLLLAAAPLGLFSDWLRSQLHSLPMCAACEQLVFLFLYRPSAFPPAQYSCYYGYRSVVGCVFFLWSGNICVNICEEDFRSCGHCVYMWQD